MKLIDKDALVMEIEKRMQELHPTNTHQMQVGEKMDRDVLMWLNALTWVKKILDTLEVKEVGATIYVVSRSEEHADYVEEAFFDENKAQEYCDQFNRDENEYVRYITKVKVTL